MTRLLALINLALLIAFPVAWAAPLLRAGLLPFFGLAEISILSGIAALWDSDPALAALVAALAMGAPYLKILSMAGIQFGWLSPRALPLVKLAGRLAMADVFLIALYVVVAKGVIQLRDRQIRLLVIQPLAERGGVDVGRHRGEPMPRLHPVTKAVFPSSLNFSRTIFL